MAMLRPFLLLCLGLAAAGTVRDAPREDSKRDSVGRTPTTFQADVLPLLEAKCWRCHGEKTRKADLDLRTPASILKGGESGPAIVPGKAEKSLLYEKLHEGAMPPAKKERLAEAEVLTIKRWIENGASADLAAAKPIVTQHEALFVLRQRCTVCHGRHRQEGGLDLRSKSAMLSGGDSGPAIVPGKPGDSLLLMRTFAGEMPPPERLVEASVKPIESAEIDLLARWIAAGAPEVAVEPDVATTTPDTLITDKDREFWAFRPPVFPGVPAVKDAGRVRNPIDAFVFHKLEQAGLPLSPEADRLTLLRRAYIDLNGLPPEPAEVRAFLADDAPGAYERLIDRLLASPCYGERWARYWLDAAGYADSEGKREQDLPRPHAWRYRDYVIRAFDANKPYDRFLLEQLAGDELADLEHAKEITPDLYDNIVATGFLRMAPDPTWANITGYIPDRLDVIADEMDVLGSAVMGLTLKCARCHSHKFDPLPQRDYYRLIDVFKGAFDEHDWLKPDVRPGLGPVSQDSLGGRNLPFVLGTERRAYEAHNHKLKAQIESVKRETKDAKELEKAVKALEAQRIPEPRVHALWDRGEPSPTYVYRRGDPQSPGRLVGPGVPSVLTDGKTPFQVDEPFPGAKSTGRRLAFARWLVQPRQPLTARVLVNRLWRHHFGAGIVKTLGNFGKAGAPPSHPELLDWLACEFQRQGWSIKAMQRLIMTSAVYRQSSAVTADSSRLDPENRLLSRMPMSRLDAEALYDTLLSVAGRMDGSRFGPADPVQAHPDGLVTPKETPRGWRRLIYVQQARKHVLTHLENFDYPAMNPNCLERRDSTTAPQALHLLNNRMVQDLAEQLARRVEREAGSDSEDRIRLVYLIALARPPSAKETQLGLSGLARLRAGWLEQNGNSGNSEGGVAEHKALTDYCHTILNSASFLYVD
jgi:hypothetical protein